jgi:NAD(P)-dependent dehydrogenase (short-subunit alcohol dehydrogenase family)
MLNEYQLSGKSALVTGVSRSIGIGAAIARGLALMGANVFTPYYRPFDGAGSIQANALYGRVGTPEDAMRLILFLASAQAGWMTGQVLHSRGGL